jgi:septum formation protein
MRLILASASPQRADLLASLRVEFTQVDPQVDEMALPGELPALQVERLARAKASAVAGPGEVALGADTLVVLEATPIGKPAHAEEARGILRRLAGATHEVVTGVAVATWQDGMTVSSRVEATLVTMLDLTDEEIEDYVATGEPMGRAGAYAIQGLGATLVRSVDGSPSNVAGLPLHVVAAMLRAAGVEIPGRE